MNPNRITPILKPTLVTCLCVALLAGLITFSRNAFNINSDTTIALANILSTVQISPDFNAPLKTISSTSYGLNMFAYDNTTLTNSTYQSELLAMNPGMIRVHNANMMKLSTESEFGWLTSTGWDEVRISEFATNIQNLKNQGLTSSIMINVPGFPTFADGITNPSAYGNWMAELVDILNVDNNLGIEYFEITNELEDNFDVTTQLAPAYNAAAVAMKAVDPSIKTGGLSFEQVQAADYQAFINNTVGLTSPTTLDFLSYHQYGGGDLNRTDENLLNSGAQWRAKDLGNNIYNYLQTQTSRTDIEIFHNEFNVCWSYHCGDQRLLDAEAETDPQLRSDAFAQCIIDGCGEPRMRNEFSAVYDATYYSFNLESSMTGATPWNDKDFFYGKLDHTFAERSGAQFAKIIGAHKPTQTFSVTNSDTNTTNGVKVTAFEDANGEQHLLLVNRFNADRNIEITANITSNNRVKLTNDEQYSEQQNIFNANDTVHTYTLPSYSVALITLNSQSAQQPQDALHIPNEYISFSPSKDQANIFCGQNANNPDCADVTVSVENDPRIQNGASCVFEARFYPSVDTPNPTYSSSVLTPSNGQSTYTNGSCSAVLPTTSQTQARWEFRVTVTNPQGGQYSEQTFVGEPSYFLLYGAIGIVSISGSTN